MKGTFFGGRGEFCEGAAKLPQILPGSTPDNAFKCFIHVEKVLKWDVVVTEVPPHIQIYFLFKHYINCSKYFLYFFTVLTIIQNESFIGKNEMNATGLRENIEISLKYYVCLEHCQNLVCTRAHKRIILN